MMPGFQEKMYSSFARVDTIIFTSNVKAVELKHTLRLANGVNGANLDIIKI